MIKSNFSACFNLHFFGFPVSSKNMWCWHQWLIFHCFIFSSNRQITFTPVLIFWSCNVFYSSEVNNTSLFLLLCDRLNVFLHPVPDPSGSAERLAAPQKRKVSSPTHSSNGHSPSDTSPSPIKKKKKPGAINSNSKDQVRAAVCSFQNLACSQRMWPNVSVLVVAGGLPSPTKDSSWQKKCRPRLS